MQCNPYLNFNGNCEAALRFYEKALGGKIQTMMNYIGTPMESKVPDAWKTKIIHARMTIGGQVIMASDASPDHFKPAQGFSVTLSMHDPAEAERIFKALSENGNIQMALQKTFWSPAFAMFTDQFGTPWMISCEPAAK